MFWVSSRLIVRWLYVVTSAVLFAFLAPWLLVFRKTRRGWGQRLGFFQPHTFPSGSPRVWLHGASAGDLLALLPMIERLRKKYPRAVLVLSTMTNTGHLMAQQRLATQVDAIIYAPWDAWGASARTAKAIRPDLLVLEYAEIWPSLIASVKRHQGRIALTNGRFSPRQLSRYRALFTVIGNPLRQLDLLLMREPEEAERAISLGAISARVQVTGNTKFDALVPAQSDEDAALKAALGIESGQLVFIAGSTHEGEEELLLRVFSNLRAQWPHLRLILAPRYIDRAERVVALAQAQGLECARRSAGIGGAPPVVVLDSIGELARAYRLATVVFVGGSFTMRGGQNILEPAAQGRGVLFGPHMHNFHDAVQVLVGRGGIQVKDADHLERVMRELLAKPEALEALGRLALAAVRQVSGASDRNVTALSALIEPTP